MNTPPDRAEGETSQPPSDSPSGPNASLRGPSWRFQLTVGALVLGSGVVLSAVLASLAPDPIPPGPPKGSASALPPAESCRSAPRRGQTLRVHLGEQPSRGDGTQGEHPALSMFVLESIVASSERAGVATARPADDADGYLVTLRPGVRVHPGPCTPDGKVLNATDVAYSIRRFQRQREWTEASPDAIEVVDARRLRVRGRAHPDVLDLLRRAPARFQELERCGTPSGLWAGTGPFTRDATATNGAIRLTRFEDYWAKSASEVGLPLLDGVEFVDAPSLSRALTAARAGTLHWLDLKQDTSLLDDPSGPRPVLKPEHRSPNVRIVVDGEPPQAGSASRRSVYVVSPRVCGLADDASGRLVRPIRAAMFWMR